MIRHIVLWKLDQAYQPDEKAIIKKQMADMLAGLEAHIEELKSLSVYFNDTEASDTNYDVMLDTMFDSIQDLNTYQVHPEHLKVAGYIKALRLQRAAIDYKY